MLWVGPDYLLHRWQAQRRASLASDLLTPRLEARGSGGQRRRSPMTSSWKSHWQLTSVPTQNLSKHSAFYGSGVMGGGRGGGKVFIFLTKWQKEEKHTARQEEQRLERKPAGTALAFRGVYDALCWWGCVFRRNVRGGRLGGNKCCPLLERGMMGIRIRVRFLLLFFFSFHTLSKQPYMYGKWLFRRVAAYLTSKTAWFCVPKRKVSSGDLRSGETDTSRGAVAGS